MKGDKAFPPCVLWRHQFGQVVTCSVHADPAEQATDVQDRIVSFVATHGAVTLFDALTNDLFGAVVGAIELLLVSTTSGLEARQT